MSSVLENFRSTRTVNPKTFLAYYATVLALLLLGASTLCGVLASTGVATWLIPWLLAFVGLVVLFLIVGIFVVMLISPSKVMLTQVSATEYLEIQRATLGDSRLGRELPPDAARVVGVVALTDASPWHQDADSTVTEEELNNG